MMLNETTNNRGDNTMLISQDEVINEAREKLNKQLVQRKSLLGNTCEEYAEKRCIDLYIIKFIIKILYLLF